MGVIKRKFESTSASRDDYDPATGACSIECFVSFQDKYRFAPLGRMTTPWPYTTTRVSPMARDIKRKITSEYEAILRKYDITMVDSHMQRMSPKHTTAEGRDVLIIVSDDLDTTRWLAAATEIQAAIDRRVGMANTDLKMRVEIRNFEAMYRDYSFAVKADTPECQVLAKAQSIVHAELARLNATQWTTIGCAMRGREREDSDNKPTVVVCFPPGSKYLYDYLAGKVESALEPLDTANSGLALQVEFMPGLLIPSISAEMRPAAPVFAGYDYKHPDCGFSIGPRGARDAGTAGIWVWFRKPGQPRQLAMLTCHHVVVSGDPGRRAVHDTYGIGLQGNNVPNPIVVDYPAPFDEAYTEEVLSNQANPAFNTPEQVAKNTESLAGMKKMKQDGGFGRVIHASGYHRRVQGRRMDWAIIAVRNPSFRGTNDAVPRTELTFEMLWNNRVNYQAQAGTFISGIGPGNEGTWVVKKGRTTRVTVGEITALKTICHWQDNSQSYEDVAELYKGGDPFATGGDSGSIVYNMEKQWVGMIIGEKTISCAGIFTPVDALLADIREQTGGSIELL
ncbi:hypothetical protein WAI453_010876 [Rhynchosporium graminicola]|uniref:Peptidase S1 domain-containing protein n=1 Tax=Rhynchosporium graminicola TaxID=2792576 RepID=A0A1E1L9F3_9HELO|nr:uncharacterized protein RCO7_09724 [Rhynchosporium commune]